MDRTTKHWASCLPSYHNLYLVRRKVSLAVAEALYRTSSRGPNSNWERVVGVRSSVIVSNYPSLFTTNKGN